MTDPPHDLDAERAVLGWLLVKPSAIDQVSDLLVADDFYRPSHASLFHLLRGLRDTGESGSMVAVADHIQRRKIPLDVDGLQAIHGAALADWKAGSRIVARCAYARRCIGAASEVLTLARQANLEPEDLVDQARAAFARIESPPASNDRLGGLWTVDQFMEMDRADPAPWVIPGLLRRGWRAMIVALEGAGKTWVLRQLAIAGAQGVHPFAFTPCAQTVTLMVDLENPPDAVVASCRPITAKARVAVADRYDDTRAWIWHQPGGINVRARKDRANLEAVIATVRPDLVCLGPIYKSYTAQPRESDEVAARDVQEVLDTLRTRYGFALVLEHHAPKQQGSVRELLPYGSSLWLRWPELGIKLVPLKEGKDTPKGSVSVGRWRVDRVANGWPDRLDRGASGSWPWTGWWKDGYDQEPEGLDL